MVDRCDAVLRARVPGPLRARVRDLAERLRTSEGAAIRMAVETGLDRIATAPATLLRRPPRAA